MDVLSTLVISDLHLGQAPCPIGDNLLSLLAAYRGRVEHLVIAGDLFDAWIGDDAASDYAWSIASAITSVQAPRTTVLPGNRDFLIGRQWCEAAGAQWLNQVEVVTKTGHYLISHGDELCLSDHDYQRWRAQSRDSTWQHQFLSQPMAERVAFAARARTQSSQKTRTLSSHIVDVDCAAANADGLRRIHGHTHRPAIHRRTGSLRVVLGDWRPQAWVFAADRQGDWLGRWDHEWTQFITV